MTLLLIAGAVAGIALAIWASRLALDSASSLGRGLGLSPFVIGMTIVAVGTDLPEVANSIVSSAGGHGDLNVGDSVGSAVTQITLVLGLLCLVGTLHAERRFVITAGALTVGFLLFGAVLIDDGHFSRADGAVLVAAWIVGTLIIQRPTRSEGGERLRPDKATGRLAAKTGGYLLVVGLGSTIAVECMSRLAESLGVPEYLLSFFVLALGTSMPELVVDFLAIRRGEGELAMGDLLGSSFVDVTLSPGIGPLMFPTALGDGLARGSVLSALVIAIVVAVLARDSEHRWPTGIILILLYFSMYPALIT